MIYYPRVADGELAERLASAGAVLIEGPKACGKTRTARRAASSEVLLDLDINAQQMLQLSPDRVLAGSVPRLIDEWQISASPVWNNVRHTVDDRGLPGQFILTGSSVAEADPRRHSGAGRFSVLRMRPMSLFELDRSSKQISLSKLFDGDEFSCPDPGLTLDDFIELVCVGGWPGNIGLTTPAALRANRDYLAQVREVDASRIGPGKKDPQKLERFLRSIARNISTEVSVSVLCADAGDSEEPLARTTAYDYLDVLGRLLVIEDQPAWSVHMRSKIALRQQPKRHFVDPSLAVAALGTSPKRLLRDLNAFGYLFESMVVRDLRILSQPLEGTVYHFRDGKDREVDAIVELGDGRWAAFEVKLGAFQIDDAAANLLAFADRVDTSKVGAPSVLAVVTGANYGYVRPDGVAVLPIGALAP